MLSLVRPIGYNMKIYKYTEKYEKDEKNDEKYVCEYEEIYDKNDPNAVKAIGEADKIKDIYSGILEMEKGSTIEFDKDSFVVKLRMITSFENISNCIGMEFITFGSLGKITIMELICMLSQKQFQNFLDKNVKCSDRMYV